MKKILGIAALAAVISLPAVSSAAMFAYVNASGEVMSVDATDANTALTTAPNIHAHSGVMMLDDTDEDIVGDDVAGI